jgi:hypothetical protein
MGVRFARVHLQAGDPFGRHLTGDYMRAKRLECSALLAAVMCVVSGCGSGAEDGMSMQVRSDQVTSTNGMSSNGLSVNGLASNGMSSNGLSSNGLSSNGLSSNGLSSKGCSRVRSQRGGRRKTQRMPLW